MLFSLLYQTTTPTLGFNSNVLDPIGSRNVDTSTLQGAILSFANILIILFASVAVIYIIYGAWVWINEGQQKGQEVVIRAVVGIIIAILAYVITQFALSAGGWLEGLFPQEQRIQRASKSQTQITCERQPNTNWFIENGQGRCVCASGAIPQGQGVLVSGCRRL